MGDVIAGLHCRGSADAGVMVARNLNARRRQQ